MKRVNGRDTTNAATGARGLRRSHPMARLALILLLGVVTAGFPAAGFGGTEARDDRGGAGEGDREFAEEGTGVMHSRDAITVLDDGADAGNGGGIRAGMTVRVRGRIDTYGNAPLTFPAIRLDHAGEPWLLELSGADPKTLHEYRGGDVLVEGVLRRIPQGPRQGLLEVQSLERVR